MSSFYAWTLWLLPLAFVVMIIAIGFGIRKAMLNDPDYQPRARRRTRRTARRRVHEDDDDDEQLDDYR